MSENCKKDAENNTVFDKTEFADRRAKSIDQKSTLELDKLNLLRTANSISAGGGKHGVDHDDYSSGSDASKQPGPRTIEGYETKWAAGQTKVGGKHVAADGLVSRLGHRRIIPGITEEEREWLEVHTWRLQEIAKQVLHGRNATIFEKCVINPLLGEPKSSVERVAAQFNIKPKRVYNIIDKCEEKVLREYNRQRQGRPQEEKSAVCSICRRPVSSNAICPRGNYGDCEHRFPSGPPNQVWGNGLHHDLLSKPPLRVFSGRPR